MSFAESVEYYPECPSCGAKNTGGSLCEYCGASMIKKKIKFGNSGQSDIEEENEREDMSLPHINGKSGHLDPFIILFCSIFGGGFIIVPLILSIAFLSSGILEIWVAFMLIVFFLVGVGSLIPLVLNLYNGAQCKKGDILTGVVRGYSRTGTMINGDYVLKIKLCVTKNGNPTIVSFSTGKTVRTYPIGETVKIRNYKDYYIIDKNQN